MALKTIQYETKGTCCAFMNVVLDDNIIQDIEFLGGCPGNLAGIRKLIIGMDIDLVIEKLAGITCGTKQTSCPDQLAQCLLAYKSEHSETVKK